jgi:hypothetical protein
MGLTRKKVTVRTKKGKTFQRSVMVRAEAIGKRAGVKKLNSLNPWEVHHTELVKGPFPKSSGTSGPGSSHSLQAVVTGLLRNNALTFHARAMTGAQQDAHQDAAQRRFAGQWADRYMRVEGVSPRQGLANWVGGARVAGSMVRDDLIARHGRENVHEVYQDPRKHVR